ncbi:probable LRR receptor-like serine/threonine-protein kinase At5g63710 [Chenopodium quinoa]|uniref:Protein kinase domain-containing protein n=1 Tax=Chenopodium quinoa TaxID=63459 RepID=A0A803MTR5_CHEQI|nr:probable LRR receptor-like serine/threonine-protein kinase At5g63710 [Chenopodium quinoa]
MLLLILFIFNLLCFGSPVFSTSNPELESLLTLKSSLDPSSLHLSSWSKNGDPCGGTFDGVGCNHNGQVANISLQGKGLNGQLSPAISGLKHLTGIYLHYNSLSGEIPKEIGSLSELVDLYLDVNNLSGVIPPQISHLDNLQVLQLGYNQLTGSIPTQLGSLKKLSVLALQSNHLTGAIPASLGHIETLLRLDLSFNHLFGSIPTPIAEAPLLESLDIRNNTLSGNVSPALMRLNEGFKYANNPGLCGVGFPTLRSCPDSDHLGQIRPEPYGGGAATSNGLPRKEIPETANVKLPNCSQTECSKTTRKSSHASVAVGVVVVILALSLVSVFIFAKYRRTKQKLGSSLELSDTRLSIDQPRDFCRKNGSPLISLEYPNGWDPLSDVRSFNGFSNDVIQGFRFNLEEVECATQHFSPSNLLGKSGMSAVFRGVLRDGSVVAVKRISKSSCKSEESEFLKGLNVLTSLRHENLVKLRGFCCSRGRGECFLVYDFVPNGILLKYLDLKDGDANVFEWSTRVWIIHGIAKGIQYMHTSKTSKPALIHQNISAEKVLIDKRFNPVLADCGLYKLLTNDTVFSALKASAAMGYLAPEYTTTGKFTEKSDVYAFGMLVFQIISGRRKISNSIRAGAESLRSQEYVDSNLHGKFSEFEAAKLAKIALSCTHELPNERPSMDTIILDLGSCTNCYRSP